MSKSKGNVIAPQKVMDTWGADILRLWVASTDYSGELSISDEILKRVVESYRRIRNTLRFLLANLADFDPAADAVPVEQWLEIDRYMLAFTRRLQDELTEAYRHYDFHLIGPPSAQFLLRGFGRILSRCSQGPALHCCRRGSSPPIGAIRAISYRPQPGAAICPHPQLYGRRSLATSRWH